MFRFTTIKDYHTALQAGSMSCIQAVNYYLDQIARNENLNAFLEVFTEDAKQRAIALDELHTQKKSTGGALGKLHGVVVGIKDVLCYQGHKVSAASKILENYTVRLSDLDVVNHANNVKYLEWCLNNCDVTQLISNGLKAFEMNFMRELALGDEAIISRHDDVFVITNNDKACFALQLEWN